MTENEEKRPKVAIVGGGRGAGRILKAHIDLLEELEAYRVIGTVEDIREIYSLCKILQNVVKDYSAIGTVEEFKAFKEKNEPKKPIIAKSMMTKREFQICPICERLVLYDGIKFAYCQYCGNALDWQ